jgi:hypothetical protein
MRFESYVILLFSITLVFHLLGMGKPIVDLYPDGQFISLDSIIPNLLSKISSSAGMTDLLGQIAVVLGAVAVNVLLGGFAAVYIVPMIIFSFFVHYFIFPLDFIFTMVVDDSAKVFIVIFFNILQIMALVQFTRGGN